MGRRAARLKRPIQIVGLIACAAIVLEISALVLVETRIIDARQPNYRFSDESPGFWISAEPFGTWRAPETVYRHMTPCFDLRYRSNDYGARDRHRERHAEHLRVVVLGDAFVEGLGVRRKERLTDVLESYSYIEHLNFGVSPVFGPTQYGSLYEHLAYQFDHDVVLLGILPRNSRVTLDEPATTRLGQAVGRLFFEFSYADNIRRRYTATNSGRPEPTTQAGYYVHSETHYDRMRDPIEQIVRLANPRPVFVFTIPLGADLEAFRTNGPAPLSERMSALAASAGFTYIDLLPAMAHHPESDTYFLSCRENWNARGHEAAARVLLDRIPIYRDIETESKKGPHLAAR